jgi:hypothetical protein
MAALWRDLSRWRFWRRFLTHSFATVGSIAVVLGILTTIFPKNVKIEGLGWAIVILLISVFYGLWTSWPRPIEQAYSLPNTTIRVLKGDVLREDCHLVIGTCDTFDTQTPNVIARDSLQGQALDRLFGGDVAELDRLLVRALKSKTPVEHVQKPGKRQRYELGTIAVLPHSGRKLYFVAYSSMNEHNQARSSPDGMWKSLLNLWAEISRSGNGGSVAIPVIGGGQSRISQILPAQDSIRFIILSFMLASRKEKVCDELRIFVRPADYDRLDRMEIQSFLSSLRPS